MYSWTCSRRRDSEGTRVGTGELEKVLMSSLSVKKEVLSVALNHLYLHACAKSNVMLPYAYTHSEHVDKMIHIPLFPRYK